MKLCDVCSSQLMRVVLEPKVALTNRHTHTHTYRYTNVVTVHVLCHQTAEFGSGQLGTDLNKFDTDTLYGKYLHCNLSTCTPHDKQSLRNLSAALVGGDFSVHLTTSLAQRSVAFLPTARRHGVSQFRLRTALSHVAFRGRDPATNIGVLRCRQDRLVQCPLGR